MGGSIQLSEELRGRVIRDVQITVHPLVLELTGKTKPRQGLEAKFSVYDGTAVGLPLGQATRAQYEDAVVQDSEIIEFRGKIHATADSDTHPDECYVVVNFVSDDLMVSSIEKHVEHAVGSVHSPMSDSQLTDKFMDHASLFCGRKRQKGQMNGAKP